MQSQPLVTVPTDLHMALVRLLDVVPPVLRDWIKTTGFGETNRRDRAVLAEVDRATELHRAWLAETGVTVEDA